MKTVWARGSVMLLLVLAVAPLALAAEALKVVDLSVTQLHKNYTDTPHRYRLTATVSGGQEPLKYLWRIDCGQFSTDVANQTVEWQYDEPGKCADAVIGLLITDAAGQGLRLTQSAFDPSDRQITPFTFPVDKSASTPQTSTGAVATDANQPSEKAGGGVPWRAVAAGAVAVAAVSGAVLVLKKKEDSNDGCEAAVKQLISDISHLKSRYENYSDDQLKKVHALEERDRSLDATATWNRWRNHFNSFLREFAVFRDIKRFGDTPVPEIPGLWDLLNETIGDTLGTMISMTAEEVAQLTISTDTINAVGGMYEIYKKMVDTQTVGGASVVLTGTDTLEGTDIMKGVQDAPQVMEQTLTTFNQSCLPFVAKYGELTDALGTYSHCVRRLPEFPIKNKDFQTLTGDCPMRKKILETKLRQAEEFSKTYMNKCSDKGLEALFVEVERLKEEMGISIPQMDRVMKQLFKHRAILRKFFNR
ncbi:hypothetical protein HYS84_03775 [Candidatus Saccharibacteria bacterium]|nr:hypothetical protein [Candidatus Saccharibacteria bacterium]